MRETSRSLNLPEPNAFPDPSIRTTPGRDETDAEEASGLQRDLEECFKAIREQLSEP